MYVQPDIIREAKSNGSLSLRKGTGSIRCDEIVDLLVTCTSPRAQPGARKLLGLMKKSSWQAITGIHRSPGDQTSHIRVDIKKVAHHLRLDARNAVSDITFVNGAGETARLSGSEPWVRPGAI